MGWTCKIEKGFISIYIYRYCEGCVMVASGGRVRVGSFGIRGLVIAWSDRAIGLGPVRNGRRKFDSNAS